MEPVQLLAMEVHRSLSESRVLSDVIATGTTGGAFFAEMANVTESAAERSALLADAEAAMAWTAGLVLPTGEIPYILDGKRASQLLVLPDCCCYPPPTLVRISIRQARGCQQTETIPALVQARPTSRPGR